MILSKDQFNELSKIEQQAYIKGLEDAFKLLDRTEIEDMTGDVFFKGLCMTYKDNIKDLNESYDDRTMMDCITIELMDIIYKKIRKLNSL